MLQKIYTYLLAGIMLSAAASCSKVGDKIPAGPINTIDTSSYVQLKATGLQLPGTQHYAIITVANKAGQVVLNNKKVTLNEIQGSYKTDKIQLAKGDYRLTKFIVVQASDTAVYASPLANSAKASLVTKPLSFDFSVTKYGVTLFSTEVTKINDGDTPALFGYDTNDFGFLPYLTLKLKLKITEGYVIYDSLPGKLFVDAVDANNNHWTREIVLEKGMTNVRVPENFVQYKFVAEKWNLQLQKIFSRGDLSSNFQIDFEANRAAKRLLKETSYLELPTGFQEDSRTEYFYAANSKLSDIRYYQKLPQYADLQLMHLYKFIYQAGLVDTIKRFAPNNTLNGFTAFDYAGNRITSMHNKSFDQQTFAAVSYHGPVTNAQITVDYLFSNGNSMSYVIDYSNENKVSDLAQSSTGGGQSGNYQYDGNINPYYQLGYPDLYFTNSSKNNKVAEQVGYSGAIPSAMPYKYEYSYTADGYPDVLFVSYKSYTTGQHLYRIKKVFQYQ